MAGNIANLKSWKPGQSGNPNGRPKRKAFIELLHEHIEKEGSQEELISVFHKMLLNANQYAWKEYLERRDGKVKELIEVNDVREPVVIELPPKNFEGNGSRWKYEDSPTGGTTDGILGE